MKCPKCGYLGFETTDRCRNCGYDFSLTPFSGEPDLTLRNADKNLEQAADLDLPSLARQSEAPGAGVLDLDRLFGAEAESEPAPAPSTSSLQSHFLNTPPLPPTDEVAAFAFGATVPAIAAVGVEQAEGAPLESTMASSTPAERSAVADPSALPFENTRQVPPPARQPLAVRRATPETPRGRSRMTRPIRSGSLLELDGPPEAATRTAVADNGFLLAPPSIAARVGADAIDGLLMVVIDAAVLVLTLRIAGLSMTLDDLRIVPPIPFVGFLILLAVVYVATFTVAGGQTIGKMVMGIKVICDDGRSVDAADGVLRALGCALVPLTLGLSYVPVFLTSDRRALHDRLAGTRVVSR